VVEWYWWAGFILAIAGCLAIDLTFFHRTPHSVRFREALLWSAAWVTLGLAFALVVLVWRGSGFAAQYLAGYLIEWTLSVDNIFVFVLVLMAFAVPEELRQRVLMWGVLGAVAMRLGFILGGAALLNRFAWVEYVFGAILLVTAVRFLFTREKGRSFEDSPVLRVLRRVMPVTDSYEGSRYLVRRDGRRAATPLLAVLALITVSDVIFAVDSIPAVFAVTRDAFIAFSSNALAVLGLRPLFFVLSGALEHFYYLKYSLAAILAFVGMKLILHQTVDVPTAISLAVIAGLMAVGIAASWMKERRMRSTDRDPVAGSG